MQRGILEIPVGMMFPPRIFELMMEIKKPGTDRRGDQNDGKLDHQKRAETHQPDQSGGQKRYRHIRSHRAEPYLASAAHESKRQAVEKHEDQGRYEPEHDDGMAIKTIDPPPIQREST